MVMIVTFIVYSLMGQQFVVCKIIEEDDVWCILFTGGVLEIVGFWDPGGVWMEILVMVVLE